MSSAVTAFLLQRFAFILLLADGACASKFAVDPLCGNKHHTDISIAAALAEAGN
jgi:hypothetical protein